jgi:hemolysin III
MSTGFTRVHEQSLGEEIANAVSHGVGLVAAIAIVPIVILTAVRRSGPAEIVGASVFAASLVLLYLVSAIYHALRPARAKRVFRVLDHSAIFVLIAGTYTPFTLGVLRGAWGWTLFGLVWALAAGGIVLKAVGGIRHPKLSTTLYLVMGWLVLVAARPVVQHVPPVALLWLLAGGVAYTAGVPFFATDQRVRYGHFVWHVFVILGTACHVVAILYTA